VGEKHVSMGILRKNENIKKRELTCYINGSGADLDGNIRRMNHSQTSLRRLKEILG
jgi:hypothetical protein